MNGVKAIAQSWYQILLLLSFVLFATSVIALAQAMRERVPADVQKLFIRSCARPIDQCHASDNPAVNLVLEHSQAYRDLVNVKAMNHPNMLRVNPGRPAQSYLWHKVRRTHLRINGHGDGMPPEKILSDTDVAMVENWILSLDPSANPIVHHVIIVSLDNVSSESLKQAKTPNIDELWQKGTYSWKAETVTSTTTLSAHVSMLSSLLPEYHGFDWEGYQAEKGFAKVPTIFALMQQIGWTTSAFVSNESLKHLVPPNTPERFEYLNASAVQIAEVAADYITTSRPHLCFVHFSDPAVAAHKFGWMSFQKIKAIEDCDRAVGVIVKALHEAKMLEDTILILTSNHGGKGVEHKTNVSDDMLVPWVIFGHGVCRGRELQRSISIVDTAATAAYALGLETPKEWLGKPVREAFIREQK